MKKERYFYEKFASVYRKKEDLINFYTANFLQEDTWPSEMSNQNYFDWRTKMGLLQRIYYGLPTGHGQGPRITDSAPWTAGL